MNTYSDSTDHPLLLALALTVSLGLLWCLAGWTLIPVARRKRLPCWQELAVALAAWPCALILFSTTLSAIWPLGSVYQFSLLAGGVFLAMLWTQPAGRAKRTHLPRLGAKVAVFSFLLNALINRSTFQDLAGLHAAAVFLTGVLLSPIPVALIAGTPWFFGSRQLDRCNYPMVLRFTEYLLRVFPADAYGLILRGTAAQAMELHEVAEDCFRRILASPHLSGRLKGIAAARLAAVQLQTGSFDEAARTLERLLDNKNPPVSACWAYADYSLLTGNNPAKALQYLDNSIRTENGPSDELALSLVMMAELVRRIGRVEESRFWLNQALGAIQQRNRRYAAAVWRRAGRMALDEGDHDLASARWRKALEIDSHRIDGANKISAFDNRSKRASDLSETMPMTFLLPSAGTK